ncbi:transposase [bacterium]|nr:transposase [bacterium]
MILYTSLLDPPAEVLASVYELRWSIELLFRFLKQVLGLRRLFSDKPEAVAIQVYGAVIGCLLLAPAVGGRVTMEAFRVLSFYLQGWADEDELKDFLSQLREREA